MVELQLDWDLAKLAQGWPTGPDTSYLIDRVAALCPEVIAEGAPVAFSRSRRPKLSTRAASACAGSRPSWSSRRR